MQTNKQINIAGLQTSNYDIYAKLLQLRHLQTYSPAPVLLTDYVTTGNGRENGIHRCYSITNFNFNLTVIHCSS